MTGVQIHEVGERIPISVLTGFLGSGKTTLLSRLLGDPKMSDTAVVINEFGDVGLDHVLVESSNDDVIVMDSGCLCCTIRSDLVDTLRSLFRRRVTGEVPEFVRLIIETTGLADPAPILHTLMTDPLLAARYRLDSVITTVDGAHGIQQMNTQFEPVKQAAVADRILITKRDLIGEDGDHQAEMQSAVQSTVWHRPQLRYDQCCPYSAGFRADTKQYSGEAWA